MSHPFIDTVKYIVTGIIIGVSSLLYWENGCAHIVAG